MKILRPFILCFIALPLIASCRSKTENAPTAESPREMQEEDAPAQTGDFASDTTGLEGESAMTAEGAEGETSPEEPEPGLAAAPSGQPADGRVWCDPSSKTNVRAEPNTAAAVVDSVWANNPVKALEYRSGWVRVQTANQKEGWVFGAYVDAPGAGGCRLAQVSAGPLAVQSDAAGSSDLGVVLQKDDRVCVVNKQEGRSEAIFPDGKTGWVKTDSLVFK